MAGKIFLSYSRRELGFVDDLVSRLEEKKYDVWLDYRVLIPGLPWKEQIDKGLNESDTVLLVVSKAAIASQYVALEWQHFLDKKKRMILLIFEAVDIPTELEKFEWVDFRGSYEAGLSELFSQLEKPIQETQEVPQAGFKMPWQVWAAVLLSIVVAVISLGTFWTIFIPFILLQLPYQIFKRSFDFMRVQAALAALPIALTVGAFVYIDNTELLDALVYGFEFGFLDWVLLAVLRSPALQRWGKPESTIPKFANPYNPNIMNPEPTSFFIDYADQDSKIAAEMSAMLKKYGHPQADSMQSAKAVLSLISRFKNDTEANPAKQIVFPVLIQNNENISAKLSKVQWIDFRPGVKGLNRLSQLLPDPTALLKALGMRPVSSQTVYPPMITALIYFIILIAVINVGAMIDYLFFTGVMDILAPDTLFMSMAIMIGSVLALGALSFFMVKNLTSRAGLFSNFKIFAFAFVIQGLLVFAIRGFDNFFYDIILNEADIDIGYTFTYLGTWVYAIGLVVLAAVYFRNRLDIPRWFPFQGR